jgi:hypothetical protein
MISIRRKGPKWNGCYDKRPGFLSTIDNIDFFLAPEGLWFYPWIFPDGIKARGYGCYCIPLGHRTIEDLIENNQRKLHIKVYRAARKCIIKHKLSQFTRGDEMIYRMPHEWEFKTPFIIMLPVLLLTFLCSFFYSPNLHVITSIIGYLTSGLFTLSWLNKNKVFGLMAEEPPPPPVKVIMVLFFPAVLTIAAGKYIIFSEYVVNNYKKMYNFLKGQWLGIDNFVFGG